MIFNSWPRVFKTIHDKEKAFSRIHQGIDRVMELLGAARARDFSFDGSQQNPVTEDRSEQRSEQNAPIEVDRGELVCEQPSANDLSISELISKIREKFNTPAAYLADWTDDHDKLKLQAESSPGVKEKMKNGKISPGKLDRLVKCVYECDVLAQRGIDWDKIVNFDMRWRRKRP